MKTIERVIPALVAAAVVLGFAPPAPAQSVQPVAPWTWAPAPPVHPQGPAVPPPASLPTDSAVTPPRAKRPASTPRVPARTVDNAWRPTAAPGTTSRPPRAEADAADRDDGTAAIDWLLKD